jgi:hypothetical protein
MGPGYPILPCNILSLQQCQKAHYAREKCAGDTLTEALECLKVWWDNGLINRTESIFYTSILYSNLFHLHSLLSHLCSLAGISRFGRRNPTRPKAEAGLACLLRALKLGRCLFSNRPQKFPIRSRQDTDLKYHKLQIMPGSVAMISPLLQTL